MSNILRLFGIVLLAMLVFWVLNQTLNTSQPPVAAAMKFASAIANQDRARLETVLDRSNAEVAYAGAKITSMTFNQVNVYKGAFSNRPMVKYSYVQLRDKQVPPDARLTMNARNSASVPLSDGGYMYLRKVGDAWKVFYIDKPSEGD